MNSFTKQTLISSQKRNIRYNNLIRFIMSIQCGVKQLSLALTFTLFLVNNLAFSQAKPVSLNYIVSIPHPENNSYFVELQVGEMSQDTVLFKMPGWMPGYYQMMDYAKNLENISAKDKNGKQLIVEKIKDNSWSVCGVKNKSFVVTYTINTNRQFVANSYVDTEHAYLIPGNTFLYTDGLLNNPVSVKIIKYNEWNKIATGLEPIPGKYDEFIATDFDILYDCPILIGNLEELPSFDVNGIKHHFIGYKIGDFDQATFIDHLKKIVQAAVDIIGDIPYDQYTFIAIGPGFGGIEHLNNTTVSFNGNELKSPAAMNRVMSFLAHEYFHHYNVKRIRPFELGPFDYEKENRTNQLWISEGLTVYYEYLIAKRSGLIDSDELFSLFDEDINVLENNPGRFYQSLSQASYSTWEEGPFGTQGDDVKKSISFYNKGPVVGLLLDFEIRNATKNEKSLDDVMKILYREYYKQKQRGFTEAEFQQTCEQVAGISLSRLFEYVYTTKEIEYEKYLNFAGLELDKMSNSLDNTQTVKIKRVDNLNQLQSDILKSWLGE